MIDRRGLVTGFAASAAAAILPVTAALAAASRFSFPEGVIVSAPVDWRVTRGIVLGSLWHFDPGQDWLWFIRHVPTGLTCRRAPQADDDYALQAIYADAAYADVPEGAWRFIGRAARVVALHASLVSGCRAHRGAVFFRYTQANPRDRYDDPFTEDAPPLEV